MAPRVFTIPASAPFLPTLIEALTDGKLGLPPLRDPLALASATLYLPTRRACRLARDAFLDVLEDDAAILPRIVPLGDIDEDEIAFADAAADEVAFEALNLPPALDGLERRLLLAQLIVKWANSPDLHGQSGAPLVAQTPAAACALADDLARLIDDMATRGVPWTKLDKLVPDNLDRYWQQTLRFLEIAREFWPDILKAEERMGVVERRDALIKAEATRLARKTDGLVIAAGSTGSIPATADLIATIANLPYGAVVLPGLDTDLDEETWQLIGGDSAKKTPATFGHPQFAMQSLLARIGITRSGVGHLAKPSGGERILSEALRPSETTDQWQKNASDPAFAAQVEAAVKTLTVIKAAHGEDEALAIAVALREAVQDGKTAALVTLDRALGRRVLAALSRWNIAAEDSGGEELTDTLAGVFARLAAEAALGGLEPITLLALLKHPLLRLGGGNHDQAITALERAILRGPRPRPGTSGLVHALKSFRASKDGLHHSDPRRALGAGEIDAAEALVARLTEALAPLESLGKKSPPLSEIAKRHREVVAALSYDGDREAALTGPAGTKLADALDELATSKAAATLAVATSDYTELMTAAFAGRMLRRPPQHGVRIQILGPLEARLIKSDRVILGGLVEGIWPPEGRIDAWLNRPMRLELGLDLPERRIGLSAHDFAQLLGAPEVILTHAAKVAGSPTVVSRFVQRLAAVTGKNWDAAVARGEHYLTWARELDRPEHAPKPVAPPAPTPPRAARPKRLSVTEIEDWLRDPYTIYARHVLKLAPLDAVDTAPGAAERGTLIHSAIGDFTKQFANGLPADPEAELIALGKPRFGALEDFPEARAFWWPRFLRIARWFTAWEHKRRAEISAIAAEIRGSIKIPLAESELTLSGIADRIEQAANGSYTIIDYKTGSARTEKQVRSGLAPQLTLEAAILREGGFAEIGKGASVSAIGYVLLKGGEPAGRDELIEFEKGTPDEHADYALQKLRELAQRFDDETTPYRSLAHPMWKNYYGDYDHLARVREWSSVGGIEDDIGLGG